MHSFYSEGLPKHFDNYFAEIASVHMSNISNKTSFFAKGSFHVRWSSKIGFSHLTLTKTHEIL